MSKNKQNVEIERWFLVDRKKIPFDLKFITPIRIMQWYITKKPTIRIRSENGIRFILCIKTKSTSLRSHPEYEIEVSGEEFRSLVKQARTKPIEKLRYEIPIFSGVRTICQIDNLLKPKKSRKVKWNWKIEVEFKSEALADKFIVPDWFGKEVTGDFKYSNSYLAESK